METLAHTPAKVGQRFGVYNGDAKGTVISINKDDVAYKFDHDLETTQVHSRLWFDNNTFPLAPKAVK